jgi:hypothetical protein
MERGQFRHGSFAMRCTPDGSIDLDPVSLV